MIKSFDTRVMIYKIAFLSMTGIEVINFAFFFQRNCRSVYKMSKTMKSLLRISMAIRNLGTLNGCSIAKRFIHTASASRTQYNKGI